MVDRERIDRQLSLLASYVRILRDLARTPLTEFMGDPRNRGSAERYLQLAIETALNVGHHVIAAQGLPQPDSYGEVFRILGKAGVLTPDFADALVPMAGLRNRLVHLYWEVDPRQVHLLLRERLGDFDRFAAEVTAYLDRPPSDDP